MPRIAVPQQQIFPDGPPRGPRATADAFGGDVGVAMQGLGNTITKDAADAMSIIADERKRQEQQDVRVQAAADTSTWTQRLADAKQNAPLGAPDFSAGVLKQFDDETTKVLDQSTLSDDAKNTYKLQRLGIRQTIQDSALRFEQQSGLVKAKTDAEGVVRDLSQAGAADASTHPVLEKQWSDYVDGLKVDEVQKAELRRYGVQQINEATARGLAQRDPDGVVRTLQKAVGVGAGTGNGVGLGKINIVYAGSLDRGAPGRASPKAAYDYALSLGAPPNVALLITGAAASESGFNDGVSHDGGIGFGLFGHNGSRLAAMKAQYGSRPTWQEQVAFAVQEIKGRPEYAQALAAKTPEELTAAQMAFESPQGYRPGSPETGHNYNGRLNTIRRFAELAGMPSAPQAAAPTDGKTGNPVFDAMSPDQRERILNLAESQQRENRATARADLDPKVQDATSAYLTTGEYAGSAITRADFARAYEPVQAEEKWQAFQGVQQIGQQVAAMRTMPQAQIDAVVQAAKPTSTGEGFDLAQKKYEAIQKAASTVRQQREADPASYVLQTFPNVRGAWEQTGQPGAGPDAMRKAIAATDAAYDTLGTPSAKRDLLPKATIESTVKAYGDETAPLEKRVEAITGLLASAPDNESRTRIFNQLARQDNAIGKLESAFRAQFRGDTGAAMRLFRAGLSSPEKVALPSGVKETDIATRISEDVMASGKIGDATYGLAGGVFGNEERASRDVSLMKDAVRFETMKNGGDVSAAVKQAARDIYGPVKVVSDGFFSGRGVTATIPDTTDETAFRKGAEALRPRFREALEGYMPAPPANATPEQLEQFRMLQGDAKRHVDRVLAQGVFRNVDGGYGLADAESGLFVTDRTGKKIVFSLDDVLKARPQGKPSVTVEFPGAN